MGKSWAIDDRAQLQGDANRAITAQLAPDETVRVIIRGIQGSAIIGTDRRAFVFKKVLWNTDMSSWDYGGISGVEFNDKGPLLPGVVRIRSVGAESNKMAHTSDSARTAATGKRIHTKLVFLVGMGNATVRQVAAQMRVACPARAEVSCARHESVLVSSRSRHRGRRRARGR